MTWPLASLLVLLGALAAGAAWWERGRPPSRLVALVPPWPRSRRSAGWRSPAAERQADDRHRALRGYVLGGAPGFVVGAVGALASNVVFGQGPWTPWQMAAWGSVGLFGAWLGVVAAAASGACRWRSPARRRPLFGAIMDLFTWATLSGSHTLEALPHDRGRLASVQHRARGRQRRLLPLFGPALVRTLQRSALRLDVRGGPRRRSRRSRSPPCSPARPRARARRSRAQRGVRLPARGAEPRRRLRRDAGRAVHAGCTRRGPASGWPGRASAAAARSPATCGGRAPRCATSARSSARSSRCAARQFGTRFAGRDLVADLRRAQRGDGSGAAA